MVVVAIGGGVINSIKPHPTQNLERPDEHPKNAFTYLGFKPQAIG
jgi:hypothetical protein